MTHRGAGSVASGRPTFRTALVAVGRAVLTVCALGVAYALIPTRSTAGAGHWPWLLLVLGVFGVVVGVQVPAIVNARYPVLRAVETLAIVVPVYLLIFARIYLAASVVHPSAFNEPLDSTTALYFTVTVFSSVGFGDIVARSDGVRALVTFQMLLNLVVLGVVIRVVASAARRGVARRSAGTAEEGA